MNSLGRLGFDNFGFIIFLTSQWIPLILNLVKSVLTFSKYNIEIYCINFNYNFNNDRIKCINLNIDDVDFFNICKCKLIASVNTNFDIALILDGDMIVTNNIDNIFIENKERVIESKYPLFAKHPHNHFHSFNHLNLFTNKQPKMKWVYANYIFCKSHIYFLKEALDIMNKVPKNLHNVLSDESILNALLVKYEVDYDLGYNYFPNGLKHIVEYYLFGKNKDGERDILETYINNDTPIKMYAFHGHLIKDVNYGNYIIDEICKKVVVK